MEPIAVRPKDGFAALGLGLTKGYELIGTGDLKIIKIGRATRVTVESIKAYAAKLADQQRVAA